MAKLWQTIRAYRPVVVALLVGLIGLGGGLAALRGARRSPDDTQLGLPGKRFGRLMLPHDDRMHTDADTEWWYFTGHLEADDGQRYGYELCAIKAYNDLSRLGPLTLPRSYEVDFAITDQAAGKFFSSVRMMLALPIYRMNERRLDVHYGRTRIRAIAPFTYRLRTHRGRQALDLIVRAIKPPLAQGDDGWVEMGTGGGSYYSSITRLETSGRLTVEGETKQVRGLSWMDHQWGCWDWSGVSGWDWLSIQLENGTDLMAFVFRGGGGQVATLYRSDGSVLTIRDYTLNSTGEWTSPVTGATYPSGWRLTIPEVQTELDVTPVLENQEVVNKDYPDGTYWEGSNTVEGTIEAHPTSGKAYVELTGYVRPLNE